MYRMKTKAHIWGYIVLALVIVIMFSLTFIFPQIRQFGSPEFIREVILGFGGFGFLVFIALVTLAVPLPIPSGPAVLTGGYVFGTLSGFGLSLLGMVLGSTMAFYIARLTGKKLLAKLVDAHHLRHFNKVFKKRGWIAVLISYAIPVFPSDFVSLFLGITKMKYRTFISLVLIGHIPRVLIVSSFGSDLHSGLNIITLITLLIVVALVLIAVYREKIKRLIFKELRAIRRIEHRRH